MNKNVSGNNEDRFDSDYDKESDHDCSENDLEMKLSTKTIPTVSNITKSEEINKNIKDENKCNAWWIWSKCVTENNTITTLSENIQCDCGSFARICIVSKDGPNKGKKFLGCSDFDIFQWMEEKIKERGMDIKEKMIIRKNQTINLMVILIIIFVMIKKKILKLMSIIATTMEMIQKFWLILIE